MPLSVTFTPTASWASCMLLKLSMSQLEVITRPTPSNPQTLTPPPVFCLLLKGTPSTLFNFQVILWSVSFDSCCMASYSYRVSTSFHSHRHHLSPDTTHLHLGSCNGFPHYWEFWNQNVPAAGGISKVYMKSGHPSFGNLSLAPLVCGPATDAGM